jgi:hypothetical protein
MDYAPRSIPQSAPLFLQRYDLDKDGRLTKKELEAMMDKLFVNYRANAANILAKKKSAIPLEVAKAELPKFGVKPAQIDKADLNRDGKLSPGEFVVMGIPLEMAKWIFNGKSKNSLILFNIVNFI